MARRLLLPLIVFTLVWTVPARGEIVLLGVGTIPGDASDLSDLKGNQSDGTPHNRLGGHGSAIAYSGKGNAYLLASDRGPKDGATDCLCRVHGMDITVTPGAKQPVALKLTATTLLTDGTGRNFIGLAKAIEPTDPARSLRFDPEGIRLGRNGNFFIADEYGPYLYEFDRSGRRVRTMPIPAKFLPSKFSGDPAEELPPHNAKGRQPNRGMEGLAISPDGNKLFGLMQSPLLTDGGVGAENARVGVNNRLLEIDVKSGKTREFVYVLDDPSHGVSEILAINDHEFLVLERDSKGGTETACKKVFRIDMAGATDVSMVKALPATSLPAGVMPVKKSPFLDLLDKRLGIAGADVPEKFEGLAFGPDLPDGRRLLIVTADNDFVATAPFRVYAFAVDAADLGMYQPQQFETGK